VNTPFTVWITGPEPHALETLADDLVRQLAARDVPAEVIDGRTPGAAQLHDPGTAVVMLAAALARHGVTTVVALPGTRAQRAQARAALGRLVEVAVPASVPAGGAYEPAERAEVQAAPDDRGGVERVLRTLEVLRLLPPHDARAYSEEEEREVIRRLKAFGYI
jgi:hypothetical protein